MNFKSIARIFVEKVRWEIYKLELALLKEYYKSADGSKDREKIDLVLGLLCYLKLKLSNEEKNIFNEADRYEKTIEILNDYGDKYECMTMNKIALLDVKPEIRRDLHKLFVMDINCVTEDDLKFYN